MEFLPILLPFLEAVTGKWINPGGPKRPFQKTDEFGSQRPKKKTDKCAPKPDFPGRPPCVYSGVLRKHLKVGMAQLKDASAESRHGPEYLACISRFCMRLEHFRMETHQWIAMIQVLTIHVE